MFSRPRQSLLLDLILPRSDIRDDMWVKHCLVKPHLTYDVLYVVPISSNVSHVEQPMGDPNIPKQRTVPHSRDGSLSGD
jgi:hypothetical protein